MYQSTKLQSYKFGKQQFLTWFYGVTIIVGTIALIFTFSRSAWAAGVLGIGIWYIVSGNSHLASRVLTQIRNTKFQIFFPLLLFVGIIISVIVPQFLGDSESVVVRNQLNVSAISLIRQSPLLGVGLGNFLVTLPDVLPSRMIYFLQPVHNIYLLLFSEVGLTGSIILGWLLLLLVKNYGKKQHSLLIFYSFMLILLLGFTDHYPITLQQGRLLFTLLFALVLQ
jgi:O-antigen ligase